ncbi:MAG: FecR family protein [Paludibacteraceae bacterium]
MDELSTLIDKLISKKISLKEKIRLNELYEKYRIEEGWLESYCFKKWRESIGECVEEDTKQKEKVWQSIKDEIFPQNLFSIRHRTFNRLRGVAAILLLMLLMGMGVYLSSLDNSKKEFVVVTDIGERAKVVLPDGSLICLNSKSEISYNTDYDRRNRTIYLRGEAYFEVEKDINKPFVVETVDRVKIKALGTKFNVKSYDNEDVISSALIEGSISVTNSLHTAIMEPNNEIIINKKNGSFRKQSFERKEEKISWIDNDLYFKEILLVDIVKILERMYDVRFHFKKSDLSDIKYTGEIKEVELKSILSLISTVSPVVFEVNDSDILIEIKK